MSAGQSTALAGFRAFLFYTWTLLLSVPLFVVMLVQAPFTLLFDKVRWAAGIAPSSASSKSNVMQDHCAVHRAVADTYVHWRDPEIARSFVCRKAPCALLSLEAVSMQEVMATSREQPVGHRVDNAVVQRAGTPHGVGSDYAALARDMTWPCQEACLSIGPQDLSCLQSGAPSCSDLLPQIEGSEHLPAKDQPAVYVANHQSFLVRRTVLHSCPFVLDSTSRAISQQQRNCGPIPCPCHPVPSYTAPAATAWGPHRELD